MYQQGQPAAMFFTTTSGDYERIKARGAEFTMPPNTYRLTYDAERHLRQPDQLTQLAPLSLRR